MNSVLGYQEDQMSSDPQFLQLSSWEVNLIHVCCSKYIYQQHKHHIDPVNKADS